MVQRIEEIAATPSDRILALFDVLEEWFGMPGFSGCMFINASAEFQDKQHPVRAQSAEHKLLIQSYIRGLAKQAELPNPDRIARQMMLLKEGAIIAAHVTRSATAARDAKEAARVLLAA